MSSIELPKEEKALQSSHQNRIIGADLLTRPTFYTILLNNLMLFIRRNRNRFHGTFLGTDGTADAGISDRVSN